jgi:integrase
VLHLRDDEYERPAEPGGWGWLHLTGATLTVGHGWGDGEGTVERRGLKHRARTATRDVPVAPPLAALLDRHVQAFPPFADGRLFVTRRGPGGRYVPTAGQPIPNNAYTKAWRDARERALTTAQVRSPLARVHYNLRHAAVSLWLNAGVPATQVADWAGHSVHILLKIYAKCIDGQDEAACRRIEAALQTAEDRSSEGSTES